MIGGEERAAGKPGAAVGGEAIGVMKVGGGTEEEGGGEAVCLGGRRDAGGGLEDEEEVGEAAGRTGVL